MQYACPVDTWYFAGHVLKATPLVGCLHKRFLKKFASSNNDCTRFQSVKYFKMLRNIHCGAYKKDAFTKPYIMETYTSQADDLYQESNERVPLHIPPYTSCYKNLLEFEEIIIKAREMESAARDIRKKFQEIATSKLPILSSSLLRKAIISVKRGKVMFSMDQLVQVVDEMMGKFFYIFFFPNPKQKNMFFTVLVYQHGRCCM